MFDGYDVLQVSRDLAASVSSMVYYWLSGSMNVFPNSSHVFVFSGSLSDCGTPYIDLNNIMRTLLSDDRAHSHHTAVQAANDVLP